MDTPDEDRNELEMLFEQEEIEQEAKRVKLDEAVNGTTGLKERERLSAVPETQQNQQQAPSPVAGAKRAVSVPSAVSPLAFADAAGVGNMEPSIEGSVNISPVEKNIDPLSQQPHQQQKVENVANLNNPSPNQPEMRLHRIESAVTS